MDDSGNFKGINMSGYTGGLEYKPGGNSYIRFETRYLTNANQDLTIFNTENEYSRLESMLTIGTYFEKAIK